jgi:NAD(P)-dependent dehydrogenase (short-subunit alcohol dehydrogenase family)
MRGERGIDERQAKESTVKLKDQVAVVTGGASGIGAAIAARFAAEGARVAIADLQPVEHCHSANSNEVSQLFNTVIQKLGTVDILVNCAGHFGTSIPVTEIADDYWTRMLTVHLSGTFYCMREALRVMRPRQRGWIINIASVAAQRGFAGSAAYSAAKAGILGLTRAVATEVIKDGIHVNAIAPGFIDTPILQCVSPEALSRHIAQVPQKRSGTPEEIAGLALLLATSDGAYLVGQTLSPNGGLWM